MSTPSFEQQLAALDDLIASSGGIARSEREDYRRSIIRLMDENAALRQMLNTATLILEQAALEGDHTSDAIIEWIRGMVPKHSENPQPE